MQDPDETAPILPRQMDRSDTPIAQVEQRIGALERAAGGLRKLIHGDVHQKLEYIGKRAETIAQHVAANANRSEELSRQLTTRVAVLEKKLDDLIRKLDSSKLRVFLEDESGGLSRVVGGDGASRDKVRRDYSLLIEKVHRELSKRLRDWRSQPDARLVARHVLALLISRSDQRIQRLSLLHGFGPETTSGAHAHPNVAAADFSQTLVDLITSIAGNMVTLDFRFTSAESLFPQIAAAIGEHDVDIVHDGSIETSLSITRPQS